MKRKERIDCRMCVHFFNVDPAEPIAINKNGPMGLTGKFCLLLNFIFVDKEQFATECSKFETEGLIVKDHDDEICHLQDVTRSQENRIKALEEHNEKRPPEPDTTSVQYVIEGDATINH